MTAPTRPPAQEEAPILPSKLSVRERLASLIAVRLASSQVVTLADGRTRAAVEGDWLITRDRQVVDLVGPAQLTTRYEVVSAGGVALSQTVCERLEATTGIGSTRTPDLLVQAVERLARITIGEIHIDFTPGQLEEIAFRAKKRGQTVAQALQAVIDRIREELFWRS